MNGRSPSPAPSSTGSTSTTAAVCCSAASRRERTVTISTPTSRRRAPTDEEDMTRDTEPAPRAAPAPEAVQTAAASPDTRPHEQRVVPFRTAVRAWFLISLQTFGGPAGQIAVMQRTLVDEKRWIGQRRFLHALNYCTLLPGPEAQQLATYVGWLLHGTRGGLVAGGLFVLP